MRVLGASWNAIELITAKKNRRPETRGLLSGWRRRDRTTSYGYGEKFCALYHRKIHQFDFRSFRCFVILLCSLGETVNLKLSRLAERMLFRMGMPTPPPPHISQLLLLLLPTAVNVYFRGGFSGDFELHICFRGRRSEQHCPQNFFQSSALVCEMFAKNLA